MYSFLKFFTGVFSALIGAASQSAANEANEEAIEETNETNYKIWTESREHDKEMFDLENRANIDAFNRENQANIDMFNRQNAWNLKMWNLDNEYNSPLEQRQRYEEAGLNPYLAMQNGNAGIAQSKPSASLQSASISPAHFNKSQAPTMQAPFQEPIFDNFSRDLLGVQQAFATSDSNSRENNQFPLILHLLENQVKRDDTDTEEYRYFTDILKEEAWFDKSSKEIDWSTKLNVQNDVIATYRAQRSLAELSLRDQQVISSYLDKNQSIDLMTKIQNLSNLSVQEKLSWKQIDHYSAMIKDTFASIALKNQEYNLNAKTEDFLTEAMELDNEGKRVANYGGKLDNEQKRMDLRLFKSTIDSVIKSKIMQNKLDYIINSNEYNIEQNIEDNNNWLFRNIGGISKYVQKYSPIKGIVSFGK